MIIKVRKISELRAAEYNPRLCTSQEEADIRDSLVEFGMVEPIVINCNSERKDVVIGGHQRLRIWGENNDTIPTVSVNLTKERERQLNIRLNKNIGHWDLEILNKEFEPLELLLWGFKEQDLKLPEINTKEVTFNVGTSNKMSLRIDFDNRVDLTHWHDVLKSRGFRVKEVI